MRSCQVCSKSLEGEHNRRRRCKECAPAYNKQQQIEYQKATALRRREQIGLLRNERTGEPAIERIERQTIDLRLRVEAAKPLLRVAIMRKSWPLIIVALAELEQTPRPPIVDVSTH
jgi:hypothetical protein